MPVAAMRLSKSTTIKELLDRHPKLWPTLIDLGLKCAGCPGEAFHDLADVAREFDLDERQLIVRMETAIEKIGRQKPWCQRSFKSEPFSVVRIEPHPIFY